MNAIVEHETPRLPALQSGGSVRAIVPQDFDGAWRIANAVVKAGMAPKGFDTPEKAMVAIMHGLEVGFTPMSALQSIAVINSRATIWGDGALGLVQSSGKMESHREWLEGSGDERTAHCLVKRKGDPEPKEGVFSVADAQKANLWGKAGPWTQYPDRMLKMRARAFALRDGFSDVLKGLGIAEEVQDIPVQAPAPAPPPTPAPMDPVEVPQIEDATEEPFDSAAYFEELETGLSTQKNAEDLEMVWNEFDPLATFDGDDVNIEIAQKIKDRALANLELKNHPITAG